MADMKVARGFRLREDAVETKRAALLAASRSYASRVNSQAKKLANAIRLLASDYTLRSEAEALQWLIRPVAGRFSVDPTTDQGSPLEGYSVESVRLMEVFSMRVFRVLAGGLYDVGAQVVGLSMMKRRPSPEAGVRLMDLGSQFLGLAMRLR